MISTNFSRSGAIAVLALSLTVPAAASAGQQRPVVEREAAQAAPVINSDQDAGETREKLEDLLKKLPPAVGRVLRTDPSLLRNESYLATYPALAAFMKQHPEMMSSPAFYFERIGSIEFWQPERQESPGLPHLAGLHSVLRYCWHVRAGYRNIHLDHQDTRRIQTVASDLQGAH